MQITWGIMMGPSPVQVQLNPVAILLFFLKYAFSAMLFADNTKPDATPWRKWPKRDRQD